MRIVLEAVPQAKQRPRIATRGRFAHAYTPQRTVDATEQLQLLMREQYKGEPFDIPLRVSFTFFMPIPKGSKKRMLALRGEPHAKKPDLDNLVKLVKDAGNGILWTDDSLVWHYGQDTKKVYSDVPRIELYITDV